MFYIPHTNPTNVQYQFLNWLISFYQLSSLYSCNFQISIWPNLVARQLHASWSKQWQKSRCSPRAGRETPTSVIPEISRYLHSDSYYKKGIHYKKSTTKNDPIENFMNQLSLPICIAKSFPWPRTRALLRIWPQRMLPLQRRRPWRPSAQTFMAVRDHFCRGH